MDLFIVPLYLVIREMALFASIGEAALYIIRHRHKLLEC